MRRKIQVALAAVALLVSSARLEPPVHGSAPPVVELVSVGIDGIAATRSGSDTNSPRVPRNKISADGRYVVFESFSDNLVCADNNSSRSDIFVRDRLTATTTLVSLAGNGAQGNGDSYDPVISADGRLVAFSSNASNLVAGDTNGYDDLFVRDLPAGTIVRVNQSSTGAQSNSIANGPAISGDGRYVAFYSNATNLVPGDVNNTWDVFVRDLQTGTTERVSGDTPGIACCGGETPSISDDGRYVAFLSRSQLDPAQRNNFYEIFVRDRQTGTTTMASLTQAGTTSESGAYWGFISPDGHHVVFESYSRDVVTPKTNGNATHDVFLRDLVAGTTILVSQSSAGVRGNHDSALPSASADGRFVAFHSWANNLVPGDTSTGVQYDVFVRDTLLGTTTRVNPGLGGAEADGDSKAPSISQDGSLVYFQSTATNVVPNGHGPGGYQDVFVYGPPYPGAAAPGFHFDFLPYSAGESAGSATITVARSGPTCTTATVDYATSDGTATAGADYAAASGTLTFLPGETMRTFTVPIIDDLLDEPDETLSVTLSRPTGGGAPLAGPSVAAVAIVDDDPPANTPPHAEDDVDITGEDFPITIDVLKNDFDPDGDAIALSAYGQGAHGAVVANADETMTYTPALDFNGPDAFTYSITDGRGGSATATVRILVSAVNDAPVAADDAYGVRAGSVLDVSAPGLLANDADVDSAGLSAALVAAPTHGTVVLNADGSLTYTPAAGFVGEDRFTYSAQDGIAASNVATVTIAVTAVAIKPVIGTIAPIPGGLGPFTGFPGGPAFSGGTAVFLGTGAGGQLGLYAKAARPDPPPIKVADLGTIIPNGAGTFTAIGDFSLAAQPGDPCREAAFLGAGPGGQRGIYVSTVCDAGSPLPPPIRIADLSTAIPSGVGTFTALRAPILIALPGDPCRQAAFLGTGAGQQGVYLVTSCEAGAPEPPPVRIADLGTAIPAGSALFTAFTDLDLTATPGDPCRKAAFVGSGSGGQQGVYLASSCEAGAPQPPSVRLADASTPIPGGQGTFVGFGGLSIGAAGPTPAPVRVAFIGNGTSGQQGVYVALAGDSLAPTPPPTKVADLATSVPQGQGTFTGFLALAATAEHTAFLATGSGGQKGLYLASVLTKIVDLRDTLDGDKAIADLRFGADGLSGNDVVFTAVFADGSEGVYHATVDFPGSNEPPVAAGDSFTVDEDSVLDVAAPGVLVNDDDPEGGALTVSLVSGPTHGAVSLQADGSFEYGPVANFHGSDQFTYKATDASGAQSSAAAVTVVVRPVNDPPVAAGDTYRVNQGAVLTVGAPGVLANDLDADSGSLTAVLVSGPASGTLALAADGSFRYTPHAAFHGTDAFAYQAADGAGSSNVASVTITVDPTGGNLPPVVTNDTYAVIKNIPLLVPPRGVLANDTDPEGTTLTASLVRRPAHGVVVLLPNGGFAYVPARNFIGKDSFTYQASDGAATSRVATVTITVSARTRDDRR